MICAPCSAALSAKREASAEPLVGRRLARQRADRPLAAGAEHDRAAERMEQRQPVHQLEIVRDDLAEAEARIDEDPLSRAIPAASAAAIRSSSHR
jgi:hypothetical protein